ncbi:MAG: FG-GAP repeat domain-containing protein, partial [Myxococcota bacterium]
EGSWERHTIGSQDHAIYVFSVDMDDDGDLDVVATSSDHQASYASEVAWYRNDGAAEAWEKIVVDEADQDAVHACNGVFAVNLDDDAALELVVVSGPAMGSATTGVYLFDAVDGDTSNWVKRTLYENDDQTFFKVYAFDVNDDGALDLVASGASRSLLLVNPGDGSTDWEPHPMADGTGGCIIPGDVDGDGRTDVVHANLMADKISWTRIGWQGSAPVFEDTTICTTFPRPFDVNLLDVDEDGHLDVVASKIFGAGLRWFESPAADGDTWTEHVITDDLPAADLFVGDIDGDGSEDLLVAGLSMMGPAVPDSVVWFERYDDAGAVGWRKHWVDFGEPQTPGDVELQDLDGDGDLDVVTTWMTGHAVVWYENLIAVP